MSTQGKAAKSASGASMSKYDVEVEKKLQIIEARLAEIEVKIHEFSTHEHEASAELDDNKKLDVLWKIVEMMEPNFSKLANNLGA
jgi:protein-tyrosine phosphatase|tara:strand:+ start:115 stop:369 length:255 start_codon:yes stop_codon:yes gene_type:complete